MRDTNLVCKKLRAFEPELWRCWLRLPPAQASLVDEISEPETLLSRLVDQALFIEATRLLAYGLPEREAVWWSCMCVRHTLPPGVCDTLPLGAQAELSAVEAAEAWVRQPDNHHRREAARCATAAGTETPGTWSALGAAWSHRVQQRPDLCGGRGAAVAVERSSMRRQVDRASRRLRRFINAGINIGNGGAGRLAVEEEPCR